MPARPTPSNVVTIARLQAALDGIDELQSLLQAVTVPPQATFRARRLGTLATEMRDIILDLLRPGIASAGRPERTA
jgi:hypothetical protein